MRLLLDTATVLWASHNMAKLSPAARAAYADRANSLFVSVVSLWEIGAKSRLGKLPLPVPLGELLAPLKRAGVVTVLELTESAVQRVTSLPDVHRDPFDRMLVCQAIDEGLTILTPDALLASYPVPTLW